MAWLRLVKRTQHTDSYCTRNQNITVAYAVLSLYESFYRFFFGADAVLPNAPHLQVDLSHLKYVCNALHLHTIVFPRRHSVCHLIFYFTWLSLGTISNLTPHEFVFERDGMDERAKIHKCNISLSFNFMSEFHYMHTNTTHSAIIYGRQTVNNLWQVRLAPQLYRIISS